MYPLCRTGLTTNLKPQKISTVILRIRRTMSSGEENDVLFNSVNNKGIIILNRPKALNALNLSMVRKIYPTLKKWEQEKSMVIIKGAGEKAFCAGGDMLVVVIFLSRLGGKLGLYLALTGHRLKGLDLLKAGVATHYCESSKLPELEKTLLECKNPDTDIRDILDKITKESKVEGYEFSLKPHLEQIDNCFSAPTLEEIVKRLEKDGSDWAKKTLEVFSKVSPTSCKVIKKN
ncbi:hypothetical protein L9F63_010126 [Diploptera punctata]|uniref:3-hydroxyisobutyryl-CoA hydrolase, mitochondrial n=1 Tax=Diploptera punctata TaxID=6984 RepID=A0AAD8AHL9_DIPPU|nr:hypothetical protein L9F63_010126 [Diploptera punctata]